MVNIKPNTYYKVNFTSKDFTINAIIKTYVYELQVNVYKNKSPIMRYSIIKGEERVYGVMRGRTSGVYSIDKLISTYPSFEDSMVELDSKVVQVLYED